MARPVAAERTRAATDRRTWWIDAAVLAVVAVMLRIPAFVANRHLTYDDGFFGLSAIEMRDGVVPFRDLFSPQGPLHLPLLYVADLVGLRTTNAPRVLPMAVAAKALAAPAALAVALLVLSPRRPRDLVYAAAAAVVVVLGASVPWGIDRVWEQSVQYNREASRLTSYPGAVTKA